MLRGFNEKYALHDTRCNSKRKKEKKANNENIAYCININEIA